MLDAVLGRHRTEFAERRQRVGSAHPARLLGLADRESGTSIPRRRDHAGLGQQAHRSLGGQVEHDATRLVIEHVRDDTALARRGVLHHAVRT